MISNLEQILPLELYDVIGRDVIDDDCYLVDTVSYAPKKRYRVWVETVGCKKIIKRCCSISKSHSTARRVLDEDERAERDRQNLERSCKRSYKRVLDCIEGTRCDRMLTLTFQENVVDMDIALIAFQKFIVLVYAQWGRIDYVAVPERQQRGAIHYHLAINRFLPCWQRYATGPSVQPTLSRQRLHHPSG